MAKNSTPARPRTRRATGEGSVHFREGDQRWVASFYLDGKRVQAYGKTRKAALEAMARRRLAAGAAVADRAVGTVGQLAEAWLTHGLNDPAPTSLAAYRSRLDRHVLPQLGHLRLSALTPDAVEAWLTGLAKAGVGVAQRRNVLMAFKAICTFGERTGRLARHPARHLVGPPRPRRQPEPVDRPAANRLLAALLGATSGDILLLMLALGLRSGEVRGLCWDDVDLGRGTLRVRHTLCWLSREGYELRPPKTRKSDRTLGLPPALVAVLARQRDVVYPAHKRYGPWGLVFRTPEGYPLTGQVLGRRLQRALKAAGLAPLRLHDLRHLNASIQFAKGIDARLIQEGLGHADIGITHGTYVHLLPAQRLGQAAEVLDFLDYAAEED